MIEKLKYCLDAYGNNLHREDSVKFDPAYNGDQTLFTILDIVNVDGVDKISITYWLPKDAFLAPANKFFWVSSPRHFIDEE